MPTRSDRCDWTESDCSQTARRLPLNAIVDGSQMVPTVEKSPRRSAAGRDGERARDRAPKPSAFVTAEEKRPAPDNRPAKGATELVLSKRRLWLAGRMEKVRGIEGVVAMELEPAAVKLVCARLGRHVDERRRFPAKFGRVHRLLDPELLDRVDGRVDDQVVEQFIGHLRAVEQVDVVAGALAADIRQRPCLLERFTARAAQEE